MVVAGFPLAKLSALVIKQISKPLANFAKSRAVRSPFFKTYICMPPAQFYHWCDVRMKMYVMNIGRTSKDSPIPKLDEDAAIELGASLLGETVIFAVALSLLIFEYNRQKEKERKKEEIEAQFFVNLENKINELAFANEELDTRVRELTRLLYCTDNQKYVSGRIV